MAASSGSRFDRPTASVERKEYQIMRKRIMASIAAGFFIVAALAAPAAAGDKGHHHGPHDCPHNAVCFWTDHHFKGEMSVRWNPGPNCDKAPDGFIGSVVNNTDKKIWLYKDKHCDHLVDVVKPDRKDKKVHAKSWI
jgi:hypothetical protein